MSDDEIEKWINDRLLGKEKANTNGERLCSLINVLTNSNIGSKSNTDKKNIFLFLSKCEQLGFKVENIFSINDEKEDGEYDNEKMNDLLKALYEVFTHFGGNVKKYYENESGTVETKQKLSEDDECLLEWVNAQLSPFNTKVENLTDDFADATVLFKLFHALSGESNFLENAYVRGIDNKQLDDELKEQNAKEFLSVLSERTKEEIPCQPKDIACGTKTKEIILYMKDYFGRDLISKLLEEKEFSVTPPHLRKPPPARKPTIKRFHTIANLKNASEFENLIAESADASEHPGSALLRSSAAAYTSEELKRGYFSFDEDDDPLPPPKEDPPECDTFVKADEKQKSEFDFLNKWRTGTMSRNARSQSRTSITSTTGQQQLQQQRQQQNGSFNQNSQRKATGLTFGEARKSSSDLHWGVTAQNKSHRKNFVTGIARTASKLACSTSDAESVSAISAKLVARERVAAELLDTERSYLDALYLLRENFLRPLAKREILNLSQFSTLFANIVDLVDYHENFERKLKEVIGDNWNLKSEIGEVFLKYGVPFFPNYEQYLINYEQSRVYLVNYLATIPSFKQFVDSFEGNTTTDGGSIKVGSVLIMPVQRLPRYILLLKDLIKYTPETHSDYLKLKEAMEKTADILSEINKKIPPGSAENSGKLLQIVRQIENGEVLAEPQHKYLRSDKLEKLSIGKPSTVEYQDPTMVLFEDVVAFVEDNKTNTNYHYKYITHVKLSDVKLIGLVQKKTVELIMNDQKSLRFSTESGKDALRIDKQLAILK